jgi:hypothetical protein
MTSQKGCESKCWLLQDPKMILEVVVEEEDDDDDEEEERVQR